MPMTRDAMYSFQINRGQSAEKAAEIADWYIKDNTPPPPPPVDHRSVVRSMSRDEARQAMRRRGATPIDAEGNELPAADELHARYVREQHEARQAAYDAQKAHEAATEATNARCSAALAAIPALPPNATDFQRVERAGKVERAILAAMRGES